MTDKETCSTCGSHKPSLTKGECTGDVLKGIMPDSFHDCKSVRDVVDYVKTQIQEESEND